MTAEPTLEPTRDMVAVERFIEKFADLLVASGIGRMPSRVFAALLSSDAGSMTAAELAEILRISPAAVSGAVRYLIGVQMIERRRPIGSRRDEYWLHDDTWYEMLLNRDNLLLAWASQIKEGIEIVGATSPAGQRMVATAAFFDFLFEEMNSLTQRWNTRRDELGLS